MEEKITTEEVIEKINASFDEKSATFSTKEELEAAKSEITSQIEGLKGLEEKNADIEKAIARLEGRQESFNEKAKVVESKERTTLSGQIMKSISTNIDKIKDAVAKGGKFAMEVKTTRDDYNSGDGYALTDFDSSIDRRPRARKGILDIVARGSTTSKFVTYVTQVRDTSNPVSEEYSPWTNEGKPKQQGAPSWKEVSVEVKKIATYVKVSKEMLADLSFIRAEINNDLMLTINEQIEIALLNGTGLANIDGLLTPGIGLPTFGAGTFATSIPDANISDLLRVVKAQIQAVNFDPTHVILNPEDVAKIQLTKGSDSTYTYPMYLPMTGELTIAGMTVIPSTFMQAGKYLVGDMSKVNVKFRENMNISVGLDQDDFTTNMVTILCEARLVQYVKDNQKPAFVTGDIATDIALIDKP